MKKNFTLLLLLLLFSNLIFSFFDYSLDYYINNPYENDPHQSINFGFNYSSINNPVLTFSYDDFVFYYTEQQIFRRTVRLISGHRLFRFYFNLPSSNSNFKLGYEIRTDNTMFGYLNTLSFERKEVFEGGHNEYSYSLYTVIYPMLLSGSYINIKFNDFNFHKLSFKFHDYFTIPIALGYSNDLFLLYRMQNSDRYYTGGFGLGLSFKESKIYPSLEMSFALNIFKQNLFFSLRSIFKDDLDYEIIVLNKNLNIPILAYLTNESGGIFFEFN